MDCQLYQPLPIYITQEGRWYTGKTLLDRSFYQRLARGDLTALTEVEEVTLLPKPGVGGLTRLRKGPVIPVDVFALTTHGQYGEDGCLQGLLELTDIPYTGCDVTTSAVAMNKDLCKTVLKEAGIPVIPGALVSRDEVRHNLVRVRHRLLATPGLEKWPLFIKPCHLGSSVGISRADSPESLDRALAHAFRFDSQALVEKCITDILEINVSVMERDNDIVSSVVEIPLAAGALTYEDKYLRHGGTKGRSLAAGMATLARVIDPVDLDPQLKTDTIDHACHAYRRLGCGGIVRFDFIVDRATHQLYFNELNPLPGSMAYYLWEKNRPQQLYTDSISQMIVQAEARKAEQRSLDRNFGFHALLK